MDETPTGRAAKEAVLAHYKKVLLDARREACEHRFRADPFQLHTVMCVKCGYTYELDPVLVRDRDEFERKFGND
jgi:hypothetical protein